jgi:cathepsin B
MQTMKGLFTAPAPRPAASFYYTSPSTQKEVLFQVPPLNATELLSTPTDTGVADQAALKIMPTNTALCNHQPVTPPPPLSYDFREEFWEYTSPIIDQGECGACWAVASTQAFASRYAFATNQRVQSLSAAYLLYCLHASTFSRMQPLEYGCYGGSLVNAYWFFVRDGVVPTECIKYDSLYNWDPSNADLEQRVLTTNLLDGKVKKSNVFCPLLSCPGAPPEADQPWVYKCAMAYILAGTAKQGGGSEANIRRDIWLKGPVSTGFEVRADFLKYWKALLQGELRGEAQVYKPQPVDETNTVVGNHAVQLVGWGTRGTTDYWIIANSWGATNKGSAPRDLADYGHNGYFLMVRGTNAAAVESNVVAGIPLVHPHMVNAVGRPGYNGDIEMCNLVAYEINRDLFTKLNFTLPRMLPDSHSLYEFTLPPLRAERAGTIRRFPHCPADRPYRCLYTGTCVSGAVECGTGMPSQGNFQPVQLLTSSSSKAVSREVVEKYFAHAKGKRLQTDRSDAGGGSTCMTPIVFALALTLLVLAGTLLVLTAAKRA